MEVSRFVHDGKTPVLKEAEDWRRVVRKLAATLMWPSGTEVPVVQVSQKLEVVEVAEIGVGTLFGKHCGAVGSNFRSGK